MRDLRKTIMRNGSARTAVDDDFQGPNYGYILELYDRYRADPASVDEATRNLFARWQPAAPVEPGLAADVRTLIGTANLAQAIRSYGYLAADLDPLGEPANGYPLLSLEYHHLDQNDLLKSPASLVGWPDAEAAENASQAIERLRAIYCGTIGYNYSHVRAPEERDWLYRAAEEGRFRPPHQPKEEVALLERLTRVEAFELFLQRLYPGKTRFSIEGLDMLVSMLDEVVCAASQAKICVILVGMAHRGRLNVLTHVLQKPYSQILAEFADPKGRSTTWGEMGWTGDVKYHMGGYKSPRKGDGIDLVIHMPANPSHLEQIDPVILGMARAANASVNNPGAPGSYPNASLPVLIHGDASFTGQGIVSETLNLSRLAGYTTGGSLHIIANNQLGFTATGEELRSSLHASDPAAGYEIPVIHVNADDPRACLEATRTACAYRQQFHKDLVIDLIGYRRYGHNEGDEPRFTQPAMYRRVDEHPTVRQLWASTLESEGLLEPGRAEAMLQTVLKELQEVNDSLVPEEALEEPVPQPPPRGAARKVKTAIPYPRLKELNQALLTIPEDFHLNSKLEKSIQKRRELLDEIDKRQIDWATAEELAFASILQDGIPIRLTGQDSVRGTFSQRHAAFYDVESNRPYIPLQAIPQAKAAFEVLNSPLSEAGALGFEVGYNFQAPGQLVLWEAQYGDFINNAQTVIDEFLLSGRAKWGLTPSLVLLLPHGNEGMGPDHSSARIERFLDLAAETNVRIVLPSTAAQYFHLLRRQALLLKEDPLPLVVFTPKSLLRHPLAASSPRELTNGSWQPVIDDPERSAGREAVKSLILCSGRIYVDLVTSDLRRDNPTVAVARVEQLYPFPDKALQELLVGYPRLQRVVWVQEEPLNMGAWHFLHACLREVAGNDLPLHYVGRPESSSPAEGSSTTYRMNQQALIEQAYKFEETAHTQSVVKERG
jgi:2-oxoglutarate dehydrogenase E1 component